MHNLNNEWFASWFDSPYYHILYKNRDEQEANNFITKLGNYLQINAHHQILDLACGKGRHAIQLSKYGANTYGVDLSANSIAEANKFATDKLHFAEHDMRNVFKSNYFSHVFNLFTSFGYFDTENENIQMLQSIHQMLIDEGILVIDFFNSKKVIDQMKAHEKKVIDGILFTLEKSIIDGKIIKKISFSDQGKDYEFYEKVQLFSKDEIVAMLTACNFKISAIFGNYSLDLFDETTADRLIVIAEKN